MKKLMLGVLVAQLLCFTGCQEEKKETLEKERAVRIAASYLEDIRYDVKVKGEGNRLIFVDLLGVFEGHTIGIRLGSEKKHGFYLPESSEADYLLYLPLSNINRLKKAMKNLAELSFPPRSQISRQQSKETKTVGPTADRYTKATIPFRYVGGLKNFHCLEGMRLRLDARFEPAEENLSILYYIDGAPLDDRTFLCDTPSTYTLQAVAEKNGVKVASSPEFSIRVDPLPEELRELDPQEHVHF